jgi:hypothetical protein
MKKTLLTLMTLLCLVGCAGAKPWLPLAETAGPAPELTLVWVGRGECERLEAGAWVRRPEFDYDFTVEQRREGDHWESVKSLRRRHPAYDGSAGDRSQTYYFRVDYAAPDAQGQLPSKLTSTLGNGDGLTDREFRAATLDFKADVSSLAPFDRYRITQRYEYEAGRLVELVELNKGAQPWVRNHEVATLFGARSFEGAPTRR